MIDIEKWGNVNQQQVYLYQLQNKNGIKIGITNFGASVQSIIVPDKNKNFDDIALGYDTLQGYLDDPFYMGAIVGRYANRIAGGLVELDGKQHQLTLKEGGFHHHGGKVGFNKKVWKADSFTDGGRHSLKLEYLSVDAEEGFPGNLLTTVVYTLTDQNQLEVDFAAKTDKTTLLNLTQHSYFNLAGHNKGNIGGHNLMMPLTDYLPVNEMHVPDGRIAPVAGTPFNFTRSTAIGKNMDHNLLKQGNGYDNSWVIKKYNSAHLKLAARVTEQHTGRVMNVYTTEPVIHFYTGNYLDASVTGKGGAQYTKRSGFCLETQQYPDAPNHPNFPSAILRPGKVLKSKTIFEFIVTK
jgi:aldose 1-epimerase